jgi:hypothetical protein
MIDSAAGYRTKLRLRWIRVNFKDKSGCCRHHAPVALFFLVWDFALVTSLILVPVWQETPQNLNLGQIGFLFLISTFPDLPVTCQIAVWQSLPARSTLSRIFDAQRSP